MVSVKSIPSPAIHRRTSARRRRIIRARWSRMFGADQPLQARLRHRPLAVPDRLPDLWRAQRRPLQRHSGLPCADRRPARRQCASGHRQARLVGDHGRPRPAARYRPLLHHLLQRDRRLHGLDRAGLDQSGHRQVVGAGFSRHHHSRHGARAGHAAGSTGDRHAVLPWSAVRWAACRCCNGPRPIRSACSRRWRSPAARGTRRRTSPSTNSAARP